MKQKIKIRTGDNSVWVAWAGKTAINSLNEIPMDFMAKFYNGAYRFTYKNRYVYAISESEYKTTLATA
jgi:hypothetical protein